MNYLNDRSILLKCAGILKGECQKMTKPCGSRALGTSIRLFNSRILADPKPNSKLCQPKAQTNCSNSRCISIYKPLLESLPLKGWMPLYIGNTAFQITIDTERKESPNQNYQKLNTKRFNQVLPSHYDSLIKLIFISLYNCNSQYCGGEE